MSNFFVNLQVYEDGLVDAWELVDLALFKTKLKIGKVTAAIPDGQDISIHHLGSWQVTRGEWDHDQSSFYKHVKAVVKDLNPQMHNLHNCHGKTTEKVGNINRSILGLGNSKPYIMEGPNYFERPIQGSEFSVFVTLDDTSYALANLSIFANGLVQISRAPNVVTYTLEELLTEIEDQHIISQPEKGKKVLIYGLGSFIVGECRYVVEIEELWLEINETLKQLQGKQTASELCYELFEQFSQNPSEALRTQLKEAYESIPEHLRPYVLGDQNSRDMPVILAIYGDDEIEPRNR